MIRRLPDSGPAVGPAGGTLNGVDNAEQLIGQKGHTHQNEKEAPTSHQKILPYRTFVRLQYKSNKSSCQEESYKK